MQGSGGGGSLPLEALRKVVYFAMERIFIFPLFLFESSCFARSKFGSLQGDGSGVSSLAGVFLWRKKICGQFWGCGAGVRRSGDCWPACLHSFLAL